MLDLFNRLSKKEINEFGIFLKSPFFNKNKDLIKIFEHLKKIQSNYIDDTNSEKKILQELDLNQKNNHVMRDFRILIEKYLTYKQFDKDENTKMMYELKALQEKNEKKYYNRKLREFIKKFDNKYKRDENYYSNRIVIEDDYYNLTLNDTAFEYPTILCNKKDNIIHNFYFQLLHCYNDMIEHEKYAGKNFNLQFPYLDEILLNIKNNLEVIKREHPNIYIIYLTILISRRLGENNSISELEDEYKKYLENNFNKFDKEQLHYYYLYLLNQYWDLVKKGQLQYRQKIFDIYRFEEKKELLFLNNSVSSEIFNTIVSAAITTGNIEWVENFVEKYKKLLGSEKSKDYLNLTYAKIFFIKKNYEKCISYLSLVNGKDMTNYLSSKFIFCKVYYEKMDIDGIGFELENIRKYGERQKKIHKRYKLNIENFRKYMKALLKIQELKFINREKSKELAEFYRNEIIKLDYFIPEKSWFLEKFSPVN